MRIVTLAKILLVALSLIVATQNVEACVTYSTDYYVSTNGDNSGCAGECPITKPCTFSAALSYAQADNLDNTLHIASGVYDLSAGRLEYNISKINTLTIEGENPKTTVLDGKDVGLNLLKISTTALYDDSGVTITIKNLTFTHAQDTALLAALNFSNLILEQNHFLHNGNTTDSWGGGALLSTLLGNLTMKYNIVRDNHAKIAGGVYINTGSGFSQIIGNEFTNNTMHFQDPNRGGGGLYVTTNNGNITVANNIFSKNTSLSNAGGCYGELRGENSTIYFTNNTITDNQASLKGGGISVAISYDSAMTGVYNNIIWDNQSQAGQGEDIALQNSGDNVGSTCHISDNVFAICTGLTSDIPAKVSVFSPIFSDPKLTGFITLADGRKSLRPLIGSPSIGRGSRCAPGFQSHDYEKKAQTLYYLGAVQTIVNPLPPIYYLLMQ